MKIVVETRFLISDLKAMSKFVGGSKSKPIVQNFLISVKHGKINFVATNLEQYVRTTFNQFVLEDGEVCVDAKKFLKMIQSFKQAVTLETVEGNLVMKDSNLSMMIPIIDATDFPPFPNMENFYTKEANGQFLQKFQDELSMAMCATGKKEYNPVQNGVAFFTDKLDIILCSTESHKLVKVETCIPSNTCWRDVTFIVPVDALKPLVKVKTPIKFGFSCDTSTNGNVEGKYFLAQFGNIELVSRLIDGRFPDYNRVIPKECNLCVVMDRIALLSAISAVEPSTEGKMLYMDIQMDKVTLSGQNGGNLSIYCAGQGNMKTAFNVEYLKDFLTVLPNEKVTLELTTPSYPGVFYGEQKSKFIVMPMTF